jgi:hypothetical protein
VIHHLHDLDLELLADWNSFAQLRSARGGARGRRVDEAARIAPRGALDFDRCHPASLTRGRYHLDHLAELDALRFMAASAPVGARDGARCGVLAAGESTLGDDDPERSSPTFTTSGMLDPA